jgi:subtilisin family serine protease
MAMRNTEPEAKQSYDDRVRRLMAEQLERSGLERSINVDGEGNAGGLTRPIPIEVVDRDGAAAFVAGDRVIVPASRQRAARELVEKLIDPKSLEGSEIVAKPIPGTTLYDLRAPFVSLGEELTNALTGDDLMATRNHLMFTAYYKVRVREGDDPENAPLPKRSGESDIGKHAFVAILDNGLAKQAVQDPWLADIPVAGRDVDILRAKGGPSDELDLGAGHGTLVAGIVRQIAPAARIEIIRVMDSNGVGLETEVAKGFARAIAMGADVLVCAFGGYSKNDQAPAAIEAAVADVPKSSMIVAAAGNESQSTRPLWPANCRGVESIAALESEGDGTLEMAQGHAALAHYTNTGPHVRYAAAGRWMSSFVEGRENTLLETDGFPETFKNSAIAAGTSFAAAAVAGAIAAEMCAGDSAVEAWDRIRERTVYVKDSDLVGLDVWSRPAESA